MRNFSLNATEKQQLLERFLRYVQIDTQSEDDVAASPSTAKQKDLARILVAELQDLGLADAAMDEWGYVTTTVAANLPAGQAAAAVPVIGLLAHLDTYSATPGGGVKPQVLRAYAGGDIALPGAPAETLKAEANPNLARCVGHTIVTSDGTTLLGADDKAGIAEIMTAVAWLMAHPEFHHGAVRIGFTTDEEVGRGTEHFDVAAFGAKYAYTLDGSDIAEIEDETFCADTAILTIAGHDVHPGYAKGKMINAVRVAAAIIDRLDRAFLPETTEARESYLHAYDLSGGVSKVVAKVLVRAFTEDELHEREEALRAIVAEVGQVYKGAVISIEIRESYRNMSFKIAEDPIVLEVAFEAVRRMGLEPVRRAIRGGTDGARLSFMGLLTPNIWAGGQNFHSKQEWVSLEWMAGAAEVCLHILDLWVERV